MTDTVGTVLTATASISAGIAGGVYMAFSTIVMPALRKRPAAEAITTMRTINGMAVRAPFMTIFFGGAAAAAAVIVIQFASDEPAEFGPVRAIGAGVALASFVVTLAFNVPRNSALARTTTTKDTTNDTTNAWQTFDRGWSRANNARGALAVIGAAALTASLAR